ncbi:7-carboxy-7-deazaguanine synthase [hydrothermal vent metagenome]|uniref:7-carboxy-7-deazaguanine synthase n=1 Tax=hydrothermal vent metagenome TaxID=652676 RepID=A0A3B0ZV88_9ZZZZ
MNTLSTKTSDRLRITEIFYSVQGESRTIGLPTIFIRLTGCPLRCQYCDTEYAFQGGQWLSFDEIIVQLKKYNTPHVTVTGGEPLAQKSCYEFLRLLCESGYQVSLETSGAIDIAPVDARVSRVVDIKTPDSAEQEKNRIENLDYLSAHDQLKFVICSHDDYLWSVNFLNQHTIQTGCEIIFSPSFQQVSLKQLTEWVLEDQINVRVQCQLHKLIWGEQPGH